MKRLLSVSAVVLLSAALLSACGGGGGGGGGGTASYTVGGTVSGLSGSGLVLQNNTGDDLSVTANGSFTFATAVADGAGYSVTVKTQPSGPAQVCVVSSGTGTISGANITSVTVDCSAVALPKTGQIVSYATGSIGDDGALQKGVDWPNPRFTDNSDGTVTDNLTGLRWLKNANCFGSKIWAAALTAANGLANGQCGLTDGSTAGQWRLPNIRELRSLIDYSQPSPALPSGHPFANVQGVYQSSTSYANNTSYAWYVTMSEGLRYSGNKASVYPVWFVRDAALTATISLPQTGQTKCYDVDGSVISGCTGTGAGQDGALQKGVAWPSTRFAVSSSGTGTAVTDNLTGLVWASDAGTPTFAGCTGGTKTWQDALDYVACLNTNNYLSHNDWRLPNVNELESLSHAGYKEMGFATNSAWLNNQGFSGVQTYWYWSSTSNASSTSDALVPYLSDGSISSASKTAFNCYAWPVRGGQ